MERHFQEELKALKEKLFQMGLFVENAIEKAVSALLQRDAQMAEEVFEDEKVINQLEIEIDEKGHALFALSQPVAVDLRLLTMILKMNTDLERMGDHAVNIAQRSKALLMREPLATDFPLKDMAAATQKMLRNALDSFMNENIGLARKVLQSDDQIDDYNDSLYETMTLLMQEKPSFVSQAMDMTIIGHNLERIADLANNIAEDTIYYKQGKEVRHHHETI
jgi:phosphate transport system protein